jgi:hypothetical protein
MAVMSMTAMLRQQPEGVMELELPGLCPPTPMEA